MVKSSELRIGNYVAFKGNAIIVKTTFGRGINEAWDFSEMQHIFFPNYDLEPIPLTEEWLVRCGFTQSPEEIIEGFEGIRWERYYLKGHMELWCGHDDVPQWQLRTYKSFLNIILKSVHQLQNIYFALNGEELTINIDDTV